MQLKGLTLVTGPATAVISTSDAKAFLRIDSSTEDSLIAFFVEASTKQVENYLRRALITQTFKLTLDNFDSYGRDEQDVYGPGIHEAPMNILSRSDFVYLARLPIQSVTHIKTYDRANTLTTFDSASYALDAPNGRVCLNDGYVWPTDLRDYNAVEITYVAGYGNAGTDVPAPIRQAIYAQMKEMYMKRGADCGELCCEAKVILADYKIHDYLGFTK